MPRKRKRSPPLKGKVSSHAVCATCEEAILLVGHSWMHADLAQHDHEPRPRAEAVQQ